jgi:hypothetical protein
VGLVSFEFSDALGLVGSGPHGARDAVVQQGPATVVVGGGFVGRGGVEAADR